METHETEIYELPKYNKRLVFTPEAINKRKKYESLVSKIDTEISCPWIGEPNENEIIVNDLILPEKLLLITFLKELRPESKDELALYLSYVIKNTPFKKGILNKIKRKIYERNLRKYTELYVVKGGSKEKASYDNLPDDIDVIVSRDLTYRIRNIEKEIGNIHNHPVESQLSHFDITRGSNFCLEKLNLSCCIISLLLPSHLEHYYVDEPLVRETKEIVVDWLCGGLSKYFSFNSIWRDFIEQLKEENMFRKVV